jgi:hypothetical protein
MRRRQPVPAVGAGAPPPELFDRMHPRWWPNGLMGHGPDSAEVLSSAYIPPVRPRSVLCIADAKRAQRTAQVEWCAANGMLNARGEIDWHLFATARATARG